MMKHPFAVREDKATFNHITNDGVTALCGASLPTRPAPASAPWCSTCMERDA